MLAAGAATEAGARAGAEAADLLNQTCVKGVKGQKYSRGGYSTHVGWNSKLSVSISHTHTQSSALNRVFQAQE